MPPVSQPRQLRIQTVVTYIPAIASALVGASGTLVLLGWALNIELFKSLLHPMHVAMNPATAIAMVFLASGLFLVRNGPETATIRIAVRVMAVIVIGIALSRFSDILLGTQFNIDHRLFISRLHENAMSPNTAACLLMLAVALLTHDFQLRNGFHPSQVLIVITGCMGLLSVTGYIYGTAELYGLHGYKPMALNTVIVFVILAIGLLCTRPDREPMRSLLSDTLGGVVARRLIPAAFLVPLLAGRLQILGTKLGLYSSDFGFAVLVMINIVAFNILIWWCANAMRVSDVRRRISEEALRNSDERNRAIMQQAAEGLFLVDMDTKRILDANAALENLLGYAHNEITSKRVYDLIDALPATIDARMQQMADTQSPLHGERRYRRKDGSTVDVETSAGVITYSGRRVVCSAVRDITERKKAEETINAERNLLRTLIDNIPDNIFIKDAEGRYITGNAAHARFCGVSSPELIVGKTVFDLHTPEAAKSYYESDHAVLDTGNPLPAQEACLTDSQGISRWEMISKFPIFDARGTLTGMVGITRDITRQKHADEALATERNLLRTVIDNLPERIYVKDLDLRYVLDNAAHLAHLKLTDPAQVVGKTSRDLFPLEIAQQFERDDQAVIERGEALMDREELSKHDGKPGWLLTTKVPLTDANGKIRGLVGMSRDITARKPGGRTASYERENRRTGRSFALSEPPGLIKLKGRPRASSCKAKSSRGWARWSPAWRMRSTILSRSSAITSRCFSGMFGA